jgi:hypothetical protein
VSKYFRATIDFVLVDDRDPDLVSELEAEARGDESTFAPSHLQSAIERGTIEIDGVENIEDHG